MPVTIKKSQLLYKDTSTGNYVSVDAVADKTSEQQINGIQIAANNAISAINDALDDISTEPLTELPKKAYKNDLTTNTESLGSSASKAYSVGDYFYVSDNENDRSLYKVTADIASGDTISAGTAASNNCIPAALAEDVNALSNDIDGLKTATNINVYRKNDDDGYINFIANGELNDTTRSLTAKVSDGIFILDGTPTNNRAVRLTHTLQHTIVSSWDEGLQLEEGEMYEVTAVVVSGSIGTDDGTARPTIYALGATSTIGERTAEGAKCTRTFVAPTGGKVNICLYIARDTVCSKCTGYVTLKKISDKQNVFPTTEEKILIINNKINTAHEYIDFGIRDALNIILNNTSIQYKDYFFKINRSIAASVNLSLRLTSNLTFGIASNSWDDGIQLEDGQNYILTVKIISGLVTHEESNIGFAGSVYKLGSTTSIGSAELSENCHIRKFTAPSEKVNIVVYLNHAALYDNCIGYITLRKDSQNSDETTDTISIRSYYSDEMADTIAKFKEAYTEPSFTCLLATDIHRFSVGVPQTFERMIENMKYFVKHASCDFIVNNGDLIDGDQPKAVSLEYAYDSLRSFMDIGLPYLFSYGNHDCNRYYNNESEILTPEEAFSAFLSGTVFTGFNQNKNGFDYYIDYKGIRIIVLCSCSLTASSTYNYGSTTASWLNEALAFDKMNIIFTHVSPIKEHVGNNSDANKTSGVREKLETFVSSGGKIILLTGHSHIDGTFIDPFIEVTFASQKFDDPDPYDNTHSKISGAVDGLHAITPTLETYTEDLWTACIYKIVSNELDLIRFGSGSDQYIHCTSISPSTVISKLNGVLTWSVSDDSIATVSDGLITAVNSGKCAVVAKDTSGNIEVWTVIVN